jgi:hypothetical protein
MSSSDSNRIHVVIVEPHQHVLEHIHSIMRKRKLFSPFSMLHFDAHPDLACPRVPAAACFAPRQSQAWSAHGINGADEEEEKNLYELLDSSASGIAEWILPLVLAANLRKIEWVRPTFSNQLPLGDHRLQVGAYDDERDPQKIKSFLDLSPSARIKVDWNHQYYLDDDSVVPTEALALSRPLDLLVSELPRPSKTITTRRSKPWLLDICLDYFCCLNPFVHDVERKDLVFCHALDNVMQQARCYAQRDNPSPSYREESLQFRSLVTEILHSNDGSLQESTINELSSYYESAEEAQSWIQALIDVKADKETTGLAVEALPYWHMPHDPSSIESERIADSMDLVRRELLCHFSDRPFLITIARSTDDGFTPTKTVEFLLEGVLGMLHDVYCVCDSPTQVECCCLQVVKDYGRWEGSTI